VPHRVYKPGDRVVYEPTSELFRAEIEDQVGRRLVPGHTYTVASVNDADYLTLEELGPDKRLHAGEFLFGPGYKRCPFTPGDRVVYSPSPQGLMLERTSYHSLLIPGQEFTVDKVLRNTYITLVEYPEMPGGGLYWDEFLPVKTP